MRNYSHILRGCLTVGLTLMISMAAWAQMPAPSIQIKNEVNVNTPGLDFSPIFFEDGIVFISTNNAGADKITDENIELPAMSILRARRDAEGNLGTPEIFSKDITSRYHEGPVCFSPTADMIYFSRNALEGEKEQLASDGMQKMRLYSAARTDVGWDKAIDLGFNNGEYNDLHPSISIDGDRLYFASDRPGGFGGMDIYVSFNINGSWGGPINLGDKVNTKGNEVFPFIHADNTLYFASTGHKGMGGLDVFQSSFRDDQWRKPLNLPKPLNGPNDDFGLILDLNKINGYFSSDGNQGQGKDEILSFNVLNGNLDDVIGKDEAGSDKPLDLLVTVTDEATGKPMPGADVRIFDLGMGDVIGRDEAGNLITVVNIDGQDVLKAVTPHAGLSGETDKKGRYGTTLQPGSYSLTINADGYQTKQITLKVNPGTNKLNVAMARVKDKVQWQASVFNSLTNAPLAGATAIVTNSVTGKRDTIKTDENGQINYYLDPNTKYKVDLYQGGRLIGSTEVESGAPGGQPLAQNISVSPMLPGTVVELPNIYYNYNDASLRPDAQKDLDIVVALMKQRPDMSVELSSHTDSRGSTNHNQQLSQRRANGVVEYLVTKGISRNRLLPMGHGEDRLRNQCADGVTCSETEHARNRRTEVKMLQGSAGGAMIYVDGQPNESGASDDPQPISTDKRKKQDPVPVPYDSGLQVSSDKSGQFYVVAGAFASEANAQRRLKALQEAGHSEAQIIQFAGTNLLSVCAKVFDNRPEAEQLERQLEKKEKMDAFVRAQ